MLKRRIFAIICALLAALIMTSCSFIDNNDGKYGFGEDEDSEKAVLSDIADYVLVRGDLSSDEEKEALVKLRKTIEKNLGITLTPNTDWLDKDHKEKEKEILIGDTNRKESERALSGLGYNDFVIKKDGKKIVIAGGSGVATMAAVDYFIENYIDIYQSTLSYPKTEYRYVQSYLVNSILIEGMPLTEYRLYSSDPELDITDVQSALSDVIAGERVEIAETLSTSTSRYIIFSNTSLIANKFSITINDEGTVYVSGSYKSIDEAKEYFKKGFFEDLIAKSGKDLNITWHDNTEKYISDDKIYSKEELSSLLSEVYADKNSIIAGQQLGTKAMPSYALETYFEGTGKYPALLGIDLGCYGFELSEMDAVDMSRAVCELVDYAAAGGIITVTSCYENPTGNWIHGGKCYGSLGSSEKWDEFLDENSALNSKFKAQITLDAVFLSALKDNGVTVLFRPLHDSNSDQFWFSAGSGEERVSGEHLKRLWIYIYEYYESLGLDNLIWVYSPAVTGDEESVMYAYPGDEYVDIVGCGWLTSDKNEIDKGEKPYKKLTDETGKIGALCLFGVNIESDLFSVLLDEQEKIFNSMDILDILYSLRSRGYSFTYIMTSVGASSIINYGKADEFVLDEMILTLDDIAPRLK